MATVVLRMQCVMHRAFQAPDRSVATYTGRLSNPSSNALVVERCDIYHVKKSVCHRRLSKKQPLQLMYCASAKEEHR